MKKSIHDKLLKNIENLRQIVSQTSTLSIASTVFTELRKNSSDDKKRELKSPFKQCFYLLGIMLSTDEPQENKHLDTKVYKKIIKLLESIFDAYALMYFPTEEDKKELGSEWRRHGEVAMPTFLHYFSTPMLASVEQIKKRIQLYIMPFDNYIEQRLGFNSNDALEITNTIIEILEKKLNICMDLSHKEAELRIALLDKADQEGWSIEKLREETTKSEYSLLMPKFIKSLNGPFEIEISDFPPNIDKDTLSKYFYAFSKKREHNKSYTYITEISPAEKFPLIEDNPNKYFCPVINAVYMAILKKFEETLETEENKDKYFKFRDKTLEIEILNIFQNFFGKSAQYYSELYETSDLNYEHDCIVVSENCIYIIEAKASPPIEPFRDIEKAFIRLKRQFQSDKGIQKAFDQASRLRNKLVLEKELILYNKQGDKELNLLSTDKHIFCLCVTRDNYGPIGTNLSLLLEKNIDTPYPWVINTFDLESFFQGFKHLGFNEAQLSDFLKQRVQLHGKVFGTDELEYAGYYIKHNGFDKLIDLKADLITLTPDYSDIFDNIYVAEATGDKVTVDIVEPYLNNMREDLASYFRSKEKYKLQNDKVRRQKRKNKLEKNSRRKNRRN